MLTYEKAISDLIAKFDESGVYLDNQNRWAVDVAFGAMIDMAKELDGTLEKDGFKPTQHLPVPSLGGKLCYERPELWRALMKIYGVFGWDYDGDMLTVISGVPYISQKKPANPSVTSGVSDENG